MGDQHASDAKYSTLQFTLEVKNRMHLASVIRQMRNLSEVVRLTRVKSGLAKDIKAEIRLSEKTNNK